MPPVRIRALLAGFLLAAAAPAHPRVRAPAPARPHPALWVLEDADTTIWLFGTVHALPKDYAWDDATLDAAFDAARTLVIETKLDPDPAASAALLTRMATDRAAGLPPLAERVSPAKRKGLARMIAASGMPAAALDRMETWAAAMLLTAARLGALGLRGEAGIEEQLKARFAGDRRPIEAFETPAQQLGFFDALPEAEQRRFLASVVAAPSADLKGFRRMLAAWARGDEAAIAASFDTELKASPRLRDVLLVRRNAAWADAIAARMQRPGAVLVAVGAGHLAGAQSVQAMLRARGFRVKRVE